MAVFSGSSLDGAYTMESFVHADEPTKVLRHFYRLLRPGRVLVMHEVAWRSDSPTLQEALPVPLSKYSAGWPVRKDAIPNRLHGGQR